MPELQQQSSSLEHRLRRLEELIGSLAKISAEFAAERETLDRNIETLSDMISRNLESAHTMNIVSGEDEDISARLVVVEVRKLLNILTLILILSLSHSHCCTNGIRRARRANLCTCLTY